MECTYRVSYVPVGLAFAVKECDPLAKSSATIASVDILGCNMYRIERNKECTKNVLQRPLMLIYMDGDCNTGYVVKIDIEQFKHER